jgi:hypothetical protein
MVVKIPGKTNVQVRIGYLAVLKRLSPEDLTTQLGNDELCGFRLSSQLHDQIDAD